MNFDTYYHHSKNMNKKEFVALVKAHQDRFKCLSISDATIRFGNSKFCIEIVWKNAFGRTPVYYGKGTDTSLDAFGQKRKFEAWLKTIMPDKK